MHGLSGPDLFDLVGEVRKPVHLLAVNRRDDVAEISSRKVHTSDAGPFGWGSRRSADYDHALRTQAGGDGLAGSNDADARRWHSSLTNECRNDATDDIGWYGEADSGIGARRGEDRRCHADQPPGGVQQRSSGIPGVDRCICLNHIGDLAPAAGGQPPLQRTDDPAGHRLIEAKGIADCEGELPDLEVRRAAERNRRWQLADTTYVQHGEIVIGRGADDLRPYRFSGGE